MARANQQCAAGIIDLLKIQPRDRVPEVGWLGRRPAGYVAGVDSSAEMVSQASARY
jgi:hypothetical protein